MEEFGLKELYDVTLRTTSELQIKDRTYSPGEVVALFDKIIISNFDENRKFVTAHGGFDDRDLVWWETSRNLNLTFSQGIFSKTQFALMQNGKLFDLEDSTTYISRREILESNEEGIVKTKDAISEVFAFFVYDKDYNPIEFTLVDENTLSIEDSFKEVIVDFYTEYNKGSILLRIGQQFTKGYFLLEGKTRVKDDITGQTKTGIIIIPKLKLVSDLSIRLGQEALPVVGTFNGVACPVEDRGLKRVLDMILLEDDIDSDM